jgi:hypothetical protein
MFRATIVVALLASLTSATRAQESSFPYVLNQAAKTSFIRGLELELRARDDYRTRLARAKTDADYYACTIETFQSREGTAVSEEFNARTGKAKTQEEIDKATAWMEQNIKALMVKRCGEDPSEVRAQQHDIFTSAELAGAREFAKGWTRSTVPRNEPEGGGDPTLVGVGSPIGLAHPGPDEEKLAQYAMLKELLIAFCSLTPRQRAEAAENGIQVPGLGNKVYWVFSRQFARWFGPDCEVLMKFFIQLQ